jgi:hypothetical protein
MISCIRRHAPALRVSVHDGRLTMHILGEVGEGLLVRVEKL